MPDWHGGRAELNQTFTEGEIKVCTWLREISSCCCLTALPGPAWVLLSKTNKPLFPPLYEISSIPENGNEFYSRGRHLNPLPLSVQGAEIMPDMHHDS